MALDKPVFRFYTASISENAGYDYNQAGVTAEYKNEALNEKEALTAKFYKNEKTGAVLIEVTGVSAENMNEEIVVTINGLDGTITFAGNDFAKAMANNDSMANLGNALYNYSVAANAYFRGA